MKKLFIVPILLLLTISLVNAQVVSNCEVPQELYDAYETDVKDLALKRIFDTNSPDTALIDIPQSYQDTVWAGLAAIFNATSIPERDSIFDIYCIHNESPVTSVLRETFYIRITESCPWHYNWSNLNIYTGNVNLDNLLSEYGLTLESFSSLIDYGSFSTTQIINSKALCDSIEALSSEILYAEDVANMGDGNSIAYEKIGNDMFYHFTLGWGDCMSGCTQEYTWSFKVDYLDCSVEYLGTNLYGTMDDFPSPQNCNITGNNTNTSQYIAFPTDNAIWVNTSYSYEPSCSTLTWVSNYCVNGEDTIINSQTYTKVNYCGGEYKGALRDDSGVVYFCPKDTDAEYILYDFTANAGDIIQNVYYDGMLSDVQISGVDSILRGNEYRKVLYIVDGDMWIEGIGCSQGLLMEPFYNVSGYSLHLHCFSHNDTTFYPYYSVGACPLTVGEKELGQTQISIYPNPASSFVMIELEAIQSESVIINIYSIDGRLKESISSKQTNVQINTEQWDRGLYLIQLHSGNEIYNQKILLE